MTTFPSKYPGGKILSQGICSSSLESSGLRLYDLAGNQRGSCSLPYKSFPKAFILAMICGLIREISSRTALLRTHMITSLEVERNWTLTFA